MDKTSDHTLTSRKGVHFDLGHADFDLEKLCVKIERAKKSLQINIQGVPEKTLANV